MNINFSELPDKDLAELISAAMCEWSARQAPTVVTERRTTQPAKVTIQEPTPEDKDFVLMIATLFRRGDYIRAADRRRVSDIADNYGDWVRRQGLPTTHNAGDWKRSTARTVVGRASER